MIFRIGHLRGRPTCEGDRKKLQHSPFRIGQIAWQSQFGTGILRPSGVGPHRCNSSVCSKAVESTTWTGVKITR